MIDKEKLMEELLSKYDFEGRFLTLLSQIQDVLTFMNVSDNVYVNRDILGQVVLDYFEDVDRIKPFEGIDKCNVDKIYAYEAYWLNKRKPIQVYDKNEYKYRFINEKVYAFIFVAKLMSERRINPLDTTNERLLKFIELLFYNFKYRDYTPKSLELMASAFFCGNSFKID